jgi:hypothetical protein
MTTVRGSCAACGAAVEVEAPPGFEGADLVGAQCPACADAELLDAGGAVLPAPEQPHGALFALGSKVTVTPGAALALAAAGLDAGALVARHARGDWGRCGRAAAVAVSAEELRLGALATEDDAKLNKIAALTGEGRVLSSYDLPGGERLWVLTSLGAGGYTTVMLPEDY